MKNPTQKLAYIYINIQITLIQQIRIYPLHSRQGICNNIVFALNMLNNNVILLQQ